MSENAKETTKSVLKNKGLRNIIKAVALIFFIPTILVGFIFVVISTVVTINDYKSVKDYTKITSKLESKTDCDEDNLCKGIYLYTVNGTDYIATPNYKTNALADTVIIYYNPSNPSENHTLTNMSFFMIIGLILVIMAILVYIGVLKLISYIFDNAALMIDEIPNANKNQN